jgi:carboxyl-terminal processing protease
MKFTRRLALFFVLSSPAAAQSPGRWTGQLITDAFRGNMDFTLSRPGKDWTLALTIKVGDKTAAGPATILKLESDSIRFTSMVGGAATTFRGSFKGDSLGGAMEARQNGEIVGRGIWRVSRSVAVGADEVPKRAVSRVDIFDEVWNLVDRRYGNFPSKGIDWNLIKAIYRPDAERARDDAELQSILMTVLAHLNDNHVSLRISDTLRYPNGAPDRSAFIADSVVARRFAEPQQTAFDREWLYAWMSDSIGYLRIDGFRDWKRTTATIDSVLTHFRNARGMVIDLRKHFGGDDHAANEVIGRFATSRQLYLTRRTRSGDRHDQFIEPQSYFAEPRGSWQFTRPVMILTSRRTVSAGENFLLGMRELPQVTVIGDVTSGAYADVGHFTLANGWQVNFPYNRMLDRNGFSWEGLGLAPDIRIVPARSDIDAGRDPVLDLAVRAIRASSVKR